MSLIGMLIKRSSSVGTSTIQPVSACIKKKHIWKKTCLCKFLENQAQPNWSTVGSIECIVRDSRQHSVFQHHFSSPIFRGKLATLATPPSLRKFISPSFWWFSVFKLVFLCFPPFKLVLRWFTNYLPPDL